MCLPHEIFKDLCYVVPSFVGRLWMRYSQDYEKDNN